MLRRASRKFETPVKCVVTLNWHDAAQSEFGEAAVYYEREVEELGARFIAQVEVAVAQILAAPLRPRCFVGECRKVRVERFPYSLIYRVKCGQLQIIAVAHMKRRPGYWKKRL